MMEGVGRERRRRERKSSAVQFKAYSVTQVCEILASVRVVYFFFSAVDSVSKYFGVDI